MKNAIIVQLRVYKGVNILKDEKGKVNNENQIITLKHGSQEWKNYTSKMLRNGYGVVKAESAVYDLGLNKDYTTKYKDVEDEKLAEIQAEIQGLLIAKSKIAKTPEQKEIAKLQAQVSELMEGSKNKTSKVDPVDPSAEEAPVVDPSKEETDMKALRAEYKERHPEGKNAFPGWPADVVKEKMAAFEAAK